MWLEILNLNSSIWIVSEFDKFSIQLLNPFPIRKANDHVQAALRISTLWVPHYEFIASVQLCVVCQLVCGCSVCVFVIFQSWASWSQSYGLLIRSCNSLHYDLVMVLSLCSYCSCHDNLVILICSVNSDTVTVFTRSDLTVQMISNHLLIGFDLSVLNKDSLFGAAFNWQATCMTYSNLAFTFDVLSIVNSHEPREISHALVTRVLKLG